MSAILVEVVFVVVLILLNGIFAMSELAVMSARKARLQEWVNHGNTRARAALELAESPNRFLSTVQVGITLVGVLAGAFSGATLAHVLAVQIERVGVSVATSEALGLGIVVLLITYFSLVIGELVPKRLALRNPERVASLVAGPMQTLSLVALPVVRLLTVSTNAVMRLLGGSSPGEPPITEEEIRILIEQGTAAGVIASAEQDMVESVFRLDDRHINTLMTPHTEIVWLDVNDTQDDVWHKIASSGHARYPVCRETLDNVLGVVHTREVLLRCLSGKALELEAQTRRPRFVPETATAARLVDLFKRSDDHLVLVIDEYGGIQGLITEHDVLEAIVGDLPSADELHDPDVVRRADGSWLLDGMMDTDAVKRLLEIKTLPDEESGSYETLGGFVMSRVGEIPSTGQCFLWGGFRFEVVDMDGYRVDKILVQRDPEAPATPPGDAAAPCP
jgi:putative hemolysin